MFLFHSLLLFLVQLFHGKFYSCNDTSVPDVASCTGTYTVDGVVSHCLHLVLTAKEVGSSTALCCNLCCCHAHTVCSVEAHLLILRFQRNVSVLPRCAYK